MDPLPHLYQVAAVGTPDGDVLVESPDLPVLHSASPAEFGGPGDRWSPETFLVAAVADCFVLTFRAIAAASRLPWVALHCQADGALDRVDHVTRFTRIVIRAQLEIPPSVDADRASHLLEKAERTCLVTNSLNAQIELHTDVTVAATVG
jgi:organic hydroperoxide reductase OsmC/OhrA